MSKKVFLYPCDSFLGLSLGHQFEAKGYEVLGAYTGTEAPAFASTAYQVKDGDDDAAAAQRQFLQIADVVVIELFGNERAAREAAVQMSKQPFGGREQTLIGVSTPLVWSASRPVLQPPEVTDEEEDPLTAPGSAAGEDPFPGPPEGEGESEGADKGEGEGEEEGEGEDGGEGEHHFPAAPEGEHPLLVEDGAFPEGGLREAKQEPPPVVHALVFRDQHYTSRVPCAAGRAVWEVEALVLRSQRKGKLRSHIVCPGFLYGEGEDVEFLFPLFRDAWAVSRPLPIFGSGKNKLPLVHVRDAAAYCVGVAAVQSLESPYLLVADNEGGGEVTQEAIIKTISNVMGKVEISYVAEEEALLLPGIDRFTVDLTFCSTVLPEEADYKPAYSAGFVANIERVVKEFQGKRHLNALRFVVHGPPMAGKTALAARLARLYSLRHISAKDVVAAAMATINPSAPPVSGGSAGQLPPIALEPDIAKIVASEMGGKEPRLSAKSFAAVLKAVLSLSEILNRGYVLDALPRGLAQARYAFMELVEMSEEEKVEKEKDEAAAAAAAAAVGKEKGAKGGGKEKGASKAGGKGSVANETGPEVAPGYKLVAVSDLAPTHVIDLQADEEDLRSRLKVLEAAEVEAFKASAPSEPAGKGSKAAKAPVLSGHNNEKDFARRYDAWKRYRVEEAADDLAIRVAKVQTRWGRKQAEKEAERLAAEAEARTLRAKRKRAKEAAAAAAAAAEAGVEVATKSTDSAPVTALDSVAPGSVAAAGGELAREGSGQEAGTSLTEGGADVAAEGAESEGAAPVDGPILPQYGGVIGVLVSDIGAHYIQIQNVSLEKGPTSIEAMKALKLPVLEEKIRDTVGAPHNFDGFPPEDDLPSSVGEPNDEELKAEAQRWEQIAAEEEAMAVAAAELEREEQEALLYHSKAHDYQWDSKRVPLQQWLMSQIMPTVTKALHLSAKDRSLHPLRTVAQFLLEEAERRESEYADPYLDPCYEIQIAKLAAKAERDAAREVAAQAKAERELAAKVAFMEAEALREEQMTSPSRRTMSPTKTTRRVERARVQAEARAAAGS